MALIETEIRNILRDDAGVHAIISGRVNASKKLPPGTLYPAINFFRVSAGSVQSMSGASGLGSGRFQFNCWSPSFAQAADLREAVRLAIQGKRNLDDGGRLHNGVFENAMDVDPAEGSQNYNCLIDFTIWYTEAKSA